MSQKNKTELEIILKSIPSPSQLKENDRVEASWSLHQLSIDLLRRSVFLNDQKKRLNEKELSAALLVLEKALHYADKNSSTYIEYTLGFLNWYQQDYRKARQNFQNVGLHPGFLGLQEFNPAPLYAKVMKSKLDHQIDLSAPKQLTLHLGYPKAASKWIQRSLFPFATRIEHLGSTAFELFSKGPYTNYQQSFPLKVQPSLHELTSKEAFKEFKDSVTPYFNKNPRLSLSLEFWVHRSDILPAILKKLSEELECQIQILIVTRNQKTMLWSAYCQKVWGWPVQSSFKEAMDWTTQVYKPHCLPMWTFNFLEIYQKYQQALGDSINLVPMESLFLKSHQTLQKLDQKLGLGCDPEVLEMCYDLPAINAKQPDLHQKLLDANPDKDELSGKVADFFKASNQELDQLLNLGLKKFGYY